jgi:hypothetical protein
MSVSGTHRGGSNSASGTEGLRREAFFQKIEKRNFHVVLQASPTSPDRNGDGAAGGNAVHPIAALFASPTPSSSHAAYPSPAFVPQLKDKLVLLGINACHLAVDRDLQKLLLDQTMRMHLSPLEVTHRVAERWILKKLLDAKRALGLEESSAGHPRAVHRRFAGAMQLALEMGAASASSSSSQLKAAQKHLAGRAKDAFKELVMALGEQLNNHLRNQALGKEKALLRELSSRNLLPGDETTDEDDDDQEDDDGKDDSKDDDGSNDGDGDGDSSGKARRRRRRRRRRRKQEEEARPAADEALLHTCGRTRKFKLPKRSKPAQSAASSPVMRGGGHGNGTGGTGGGGSSNGTKSWWRIDDQAVAWQPRKRVAAWFTPPPFDWAPLEAGCPVEWAFMLRAAEALRRALAKLDGNGNNGNGYDYGNGNDGEPPPFRPAAVADVFVYQELKTAIEDLEGLFADADHDAAQELRHPVVPVGDFKGQRRLNSGHCGDVKRLRDRLERELLPLPLQRARQRLEQLEEQLGSMMGVFGKTETLQRSVRGHLGRVKAKKRRVRVVKARRQIKRFIRSRVMRCVR